MDSPSTTHTSMRILAKANTSDLALIVESTSPHPCLNPASPPPHPCPTLPQPPPHHCPTPASPLQHASGRPSARAAHLAHKQCLAVRAHEHERDPPMPLRDKGKSPRRHAARLPGVHLGGGDVSLFAIPLELRKAPALCRRRLLVILWPLKPPRAAQEGVRRAVHPRRQQTERLCIGSCDTGLAPLAVGGAGASAPHRD